MRENGKHNRARPVWLVLLIALTMLTGCLGPDPTAIPPAATSTAVATLPTPTAAPTATTVAAASPTQAGPPGFPGASAYWTTGNKEGLGTSVTGDSKVWYTLANGTMSEVYYPRGDTANVRAFEFAVSDGSSFVERESDGATHSYRLADPRSLTYEQANASNSGHYQISKTYITDPARATVLMQVVFTPLQAGTYHLYALYDPAISNSSRGDTASRNGSGGDVALIASSGNIASALVASTGFTRTSNGFVGASDGWTDLQTDYTLDWDYDLARFGNVLQTGEIPLAASAPTTFTLALGFGDSVASAESTARASLAQPFAQTMAAYQQGWHDYLDSLTPAPAGLTGRLATQYDVAVMTIKAHEDKANPGAFIASLTLPWGFGVNADEGGGGYHFIWPRDMYEQVSALLAAGDTAAGDRAVTWLFTRQQMYDGSFPQNSRVDGSVVQNGLQLDEVAYPIILAWQMGRTDDATWAGVRKAANIIVERGPSTPQERWEETSGYSPSTIAAEIAALVAAADMARAKGDAARAALWTGIADEWQRSTEKWMFTTNGPVGDGNYYVRITRTGDPNAGIIREYANNAGTHRENSVLDAGFLELVRLGVKAPDDKYVADSLAETDASISVDTPSGRMWYRYTYDGYGEKADGSPWNFDPGTKGRLWPLLSGERGEYEVANGRDALSYLQTMANAANDAYLIPEQAWDQTDPTDYGYQFGKATGSASPLAWAMAQYIRLARAIDAGHPLETPAVVADRYASGAQRSTPTLEITIPTPGTPAIGATVTVQGTTNAAQIFVGVGDAVQEVTPANGAFAAMLTLKGSDDLITVVAQAEDGGTNMRRIEARP